jgi:hypothetical protein
MQEHAEAFLLFFQPEDAPQILEFTWCNPSGSHKKHATKLSA